MPSIRRVVARNQARNESQIVERVEIISEETAENCLFHHAEESGIDLDRLPDENIQLFIQTIRFAPLDVPTEQIANDCGIRVENYIQEESDYSGIRIENSAQGEHMSPSLDSLDDFDSWYTNVVVGRTNLAQAESVSVQSGRFDFNGSTASPVFLSNSSMPKKKRRPRRSERDMMMEIVRGDNFPKPNFRDWSSNKELNEIVNDWYRNVEYREQWIFARREREGFNRRNIGMFNLDDVMSRMTKRKNGHRLDTEKSKFYDWKLGGTDWTLQLELYQHEQQYFLISRHIHNPSNAEIKYEVRYWNGEMFKQVNALFVENSNRIEHFERAFGSNNPDSMYYAEPWQDDEEYESDPFEMEMEYENDEGDRY